jgi:pimeloyl-[acyl-carrier protein] synthase
MNRFNPLAPHILRNPYPHYAHYRQNAPVHWGEPGDPDTAGTWYLFAHNDVVAALKDVRLGREVWRVNNAIALPINPAFAPLQQMMTQWMILRDPPAHTKLRALMSQAFTPRMVAQAEPNIEASAHALLDAALAHSTSGEMDLIADYARTLPVLVIANVLGVPREDHATFLPWAIALAQAIEFRQTDDVRTQGTAAMQATLAYLHEVIAQRRREPRPDLISGLIQAQENGERLNDEELLGTLTHMMTVGNDPTQHLIGNAVLWLARTPHLLQHVRAHPQDLEPALNELQRYDSSVQATFRFALQDGVIGGQTIRAGEQVALLFGSALRDPAYCAAPDEIRINRANNWLPFGGGIHFCLGAAMARLIGVVALRVLLTRLGDWVLVDNAPDYEERLAVRGVKHLRIQIKEKP